MTPAPFLDRARHEALRYGSDPWVFVRELLQNARDAGARAVSIRAEEKEHLARIVCSDDGAGMTFEHARRYLFALYASSKDGERGAAGRFGVGFWSILRFDPSRLIVRSWPRGEPAWEIELDGALTRVVRRTPTTLRSRGTEVILERPAGDGHLARRVRDAARQSGRFLRQRDTRRGPLDVRVNGESIVARFDLPAPSATFRKGGLRGVVSLGAESRVELFAQGLRVRSAAALEDLLSPEGSSRQTRVQFHAVADGVAPQALLDGDGIEPMLARADVRETRALRRLVTLAQRELRRLVERQIDAVAPRSRWRRMRAVLWPALGASIVLLGAWRGRHAFGPPPSLPAITVSGPSAYRDLGGRYEGPRTDPFPSDASPLALRYSPEAARLHFAALLLARPFAEPPAVLPLGHYDSAVCLQDGRCVDVIVLVDDGPGIVRLPRPTGHRVVAESVKWDGRVIPLVASAAGEPAVRLSTRTRGVLTYRTAPAAAPLDAVAAGRPALPPPLMELAEALRRLPLGARAETATAWVSRHVAYSTATAVVERYRAASAAGRPLLETALEIGAGDCDVQNGVLTLLLQNAELQAQLAVGYVGAGGVALAPPHAWVEYRSDDGPWRVADASRRLPSTGEAASGMPLATGPAPAASAPAVAPATPSSPAPRMTPPRRSWPWLRPALAVGGATALTALAGLALARTRRVTRLAPRQDVATLIHGALQRPEAFRDVPALYQRPLIPLLGGGRLSIGVAWTLASERRLFIGTASSELARRAAAEGTPVLDRAHREARAVADALGAMDLDEWDVFVRRGRRTPLLSALDGKLRRFGEPWQVQVADGIGAPAVLDLPAGRRLSRIVVVDAAEPWLVAAEGRFRERRAEGLLAAVLQLADVLRLSADDRRRIVPPLAREALREAGA